MINLFLDQQIFRLREYNFHLFLTKQISRSGFVDHLEVSLILVLKSEARNEKEADLALQKQRHSNVSHIMF